MHLNINLAKHACSGGAYKIGYKCIGGGGGGGGGEGGRINRIYMYLHVCLLSTPDIKQDFGQL